MKDIIKNIIQSIKLKKKKEEENDFTQFLDLDNGLLNNITPYHIVEEEDYVKLGSNYTRTLVVMSFQTVLNREAIQQLQEMNKNVSISTHYERTDREFIRSQMSKAIKQNRNRQIDNNVDDATKVEADLQSKDATRVIQEMATGNESMFFLHLYIHIVAKNLDELDKLTQSVKSIVGATGTAYEASKKALSAFEAFLPLNSNDKVSNLSSRLVNSEAASYMFPLHENEMFDEEGSFVGVNAKTKNVILVNRHKLLNKHKFYIGMSGLGKSSALFKDAVNEWREGAKVFAVDPKGEFGVPFANLGGTHIKFDQTGKNVINIFDLPKRDLIDADEDLTVNPIHNKIPTILVLFQLMYKKMNDIQYNLLSDVLINTYAAKGLSEQSDFSSLKAEDMPTLTDFDNELEKLKAEPEKYKHLEEFRLSISAYVNGIYSKLLNGITNVDVNNDLVAYDTKYFSNNEQIQSIIYYIIMDNMMNIGINNVDGDELRFIFDECHVIADPKMPLAMRQLYFMLKVLRSFNVGISSATQSISDFLSAKDGTRNYGEAVITQSVQKLFLPVDITEIKLLEKELGYEFSKRERSILTVKDGDKKKQAGKGILFVGNKKIQCNVVLNDLEAQIWFERKKIEDIAV